MCRHELFHEIQLLSTTRSVPGTKYVNHSTRTQSLGNDSLANVVMVTMEKTVTTQSDRALGI